MKFYAKDKYGSYRTSYHAKAPSHPQTKRLAKNYLDTVKADTTHFCRMFDYRNNGGDWGNSRDSIERSIRYLTSREVQDTSRADEKNR